MTPSNDPLDTTNLPKLTAIHKPAPTDTNKNPKPRSISFDYDFGANLAQSVSKFGEAAVHKLFLDAAREDVLGEAKRLLQSGRNGTKLRTDPEVLKSIASYKAGTDQASIERAINLAKQVAALSPEALAAAGLSLKQ